MQIRYAKGEDVPAITAIYNAGIAAGTGTFETRLRKKQEVATWLKGDALYPVLVAEKDGKILGWARLMQYRPRDCYAHIAEFSIYLDESATGQGIGTQLLSKLLEVAKVWGFHKVLSRIFTFNQASRALCKKLGFREVGIYERHGLLNGEWLDVVIVEKQVQE
ncbi:arsinothricin resistance N-acetyltransferase ArsN1 [Aliiglaciecola sp. CAU 1673]|uniref:arsinothricin resistance N-acetyltransferase ArsN1 family A n=1 Tax=Aliiglaciecola sp. CAU 1673 TaxID=3032595 RepID=UPI0023DA94A9|nr:arsinothricin resistance N-acetyltransferase ArsN1 family A [Aliiglaciecola sp. CAU 1673]MDF2178367.1 arsinothricin resistance N-acetyltransferase ArsN1 [Aliiglaciecola sp. CAU 1673]